LACALRFFPALGDQSEARLQSWNDLRAGLRCCGFGLLRD